MFLSGRINLGHCLKLLLSRVHSFLIFRSISKSFRGSISGAFVRAVLKLTRIAGAYGLCQLIHDMQLRGAACFILWFWYVTPQNQFLCSFLTPDRGILGATRPWSHSSPWNKRSLQKSLGVRVATDLFVYRGARTLNMAVCRSQIHFFCSVSLQASQFFATAVASACMRGRFIPFQFFLLSSAPGKFRAAKQGFVLPEQSMISR